MNDKVMVPVDLIGRLRYWADRYDDFFPPIHGDENTRMSGTMREAADALAAGPTERRVAQRRSGKWTGHSRRQNERRAAAPDYSSVPMGPVGATYPTEPTDHLSDPDSKQREAQARQARGEGLPGDAIVAHPESITAPDPSPYSITGAQHFNMENTQVVTKPSKSTLPLSKQEIEGMFVWNKWAESNAPLFEQALRAIELEQRVANLDQALKDQIEEYTKCLGDKLEAERENAELKARMK